MIVLGHPFGNTFVRAALTAFDQAGILDSFFTTLAFSPRTLGWLPQKLGAELDRRTFPVAAGKIHRSSVREWVRLLAPKIGVTAIARHEQGWASVDEVCRALDRRVARALPGRKVEGVYAYEDAALETFRAAKRCGVRCVYDLPIGHWRAARQLLEEEARLLPEWAATLPGNLDSLEKLRRKDEELTLADVVIVPSTFTRETLKTAPFVLPNVVTVPFGAPPPLSESRSPRESDKLRVLFVGGLSQRKGVAYLLQAMERLAGARQKSPIELTIIGRRVADCRPLDEALGQYRYIPSLPHDEILREMAAHDVLVFPSLFEGLALVQLEAMSRGLVVIGTPNSGADDIITDGVDGYLVPIRDADAIATRLDRLASDRALLRELGRSAVAKASGFTWELYGKRLLEIVSSLSP